MVLWEAERLLVVLWRGWCWAFVTGSSKWKICEWFLGENVLFCAWSWDNGEAKTEDAPELM